MPQFKNGFRLSAYHPDNQCTTFFLRHGIEIRVKNKSLRFRSNFADPIEANRRRSASYVEDLTIEER